MAAPSPEEAAALAAFHRRRLLVERIDRACKGKDVVDVFAALQTVLGNYASQFAGSEEKATEMLETSLMDTLDVVKGYFERKGKLQ